MDLTRQKLEIFVDQCSQLKENFRGLFFKISSNDETAKATGIIVLKLVSTFSVFHVYYSISAFPN
jgi:hypothetical protein